MYTIARRTFAVGSALLAFSLAVDAGAQQTVKIGVLYPLTGNAASAGNHAKMASELGADIVNNGDPELAKLMPLAKGGGLAGLKGAKIELVVADNQGTPAAGQNQALRLITEEKVCALIGAYQSGVTLTASAIAVICVGETPQQPPTILSNPACANSPSTPAIYSGESS